MMAASYTIWLAAIFLAHKNTTEETIMKIDRIEVANVAGIARAEINTTGPVLVVAGANMAGKTSIRDAVLMAMTGEISRVSKKKDLPLIVHDNAKKGRATAFSDGEVIGQYLLPKGEFAGPDMDGADHLPYVLAPERFASLDLNARRTALYGITKSGAKMADIVELLGRYGCDAAKFDEVKPMLRAGFTEAEKSARERATESKGQWKQVTGETWGSDKADGWKPEPVQAPSMEEIEDAHSAYEAAEQDYAEASATLGERRAELKQAQQEAQRLEQLKESADLLGRRQAKLAEDRARLAEWESKLAAAIAAKSGANILRCPCCDGSLELVDGKLISAEGKQQGDQSEAKRIPEYEGYVSSARRAVENSERDVAASLSAQSQIAEYGSVTPVSDEAIENATQVVAELRQARDAAKYKYDELMLAKEKADTLEDLEASAASHHADAMAWLKIAEALSPSGIPSHIVGKAIKPFNQSLEMMANIAEWPSVELRDDMEILSEGRPFGLLSESQQWRANTLIALAIAQITGLKIVMLDRFDVLEPSARGQLFNLLLELADLSAIDQAIVLGTLKNKPDMGDEIQVAWVHNKIVEA